jgi:hypothetical protein
MHLVLPTKEVCFIDHVSPMLPLPEYSAALATFIKASVPLNEFLNIDALRAQLIDLMRPQNFLA